jgi:[ribosomal protein S18]-alanine N-acetyltransferase
MQAKIRWMIRRDMPEVMEIEELGFEFPWSEKDFMRCLRQRNCIGMVAEHGDRVVGFMIYELHKKRLEILKCAVHPNWRAEGIGRQMMEKLINKLSHQRRDKLTASVPERNLDAQLFFRAMGMRAIAIVDDNYVMQFAMHEPVEIT